MAISMIWANINNVVPNPLNPRSDITVKNAEMLDIIKQKGWETGITCYEKGSEYIILSGHRRWYAAKKLKVKEVPIILVEAPKSNAEELKRLWSVQGGKEDWSSYEWAKYTYEMWIVWDKCSFEELSLIMRRKSRWVAERIRVFQYYPHDEIEEGFSTGVLNITILYRLIGWLEKLSCQKPGLIAVLTNKMVRAVMLNKMKNGLVSAMDLKNDKYFLESSDEQIKNFLSDSKMKLKDILNNEEGSTKEKGISMVRKKLNDFTTYLSKLNIDKIENPQCLLNDINNIRLEVDRRRDELRHRFGL
jgi:ParB family chromosome partitioning protein